MAPALGPSASVLEVPIEVAEAALTAVACADYHFGLFSAGASCPGI